MLSLYIKQMHMIQKKERKKKEKKQKKVTVVRCGMSTAVHLP